MSTIITISVITRTTITISFVLFLFFFLTRPGTCMSISSHFSIVLTLKMAHLWRKGEKRNEKERECGEGHRRRGVSILRRGASFSSTICSWFCKLDALFVSNRSHMLGAARHEQQGPPHLLQTTARRDPSHRLTTNHNRV